MNDYTSLVLIGPWLEICQKAGIPHIPATFSQGFDFGEMYACLDGEGLDKWASLRDAILWTEQEIAGRYARGERAMWRWECCSGGMLKFLLSEGEGFEGLSAHSSDVFRSVDVDDPRVFDCAVGNSLRLCVRPWIEAQRIDGYPVEFRVYYGPDGYQGISSYYPQRPLPESAEIVQAVFTACLSTKRIYTSGVWPVGFTADFLVSETDEVLFIEGGPPHRAKGPGANAHPCCFAPGQIEGVALAPREGALMR